MIEIKSITYKEIIPLWKLLWADRVANMVPSSSMILPDDLGPNRKYTFSVGTPKFLGAYDNGILVGVNSLHDVGENQSRSRGLYVLESHRYQGIANKLLLRTIEMSSPNKIMWSFPKHESLTVYLKSGYSQISDPLIDLCENKINYYVAIR